MTKKNNLYFLFIGVLITILNIKYTFITGSQHDYKIVIELSKDIINGANPWDLHGNFYGPLIWLFTCLSIFHDLTPKLANLFFWNLTLILILIFSVKSKYLKYLIFLLFNSPNFWVEIYKFGHFEGTLSFFVILGLILFDKKKYNLSGFIFAMGCCFKISILVIIPFLIFKQFNNLKKYKLNINFSFAYSFFITFVLIYLITGSLYDLKSITNLIGIGQVKSEHMSFFRFLSGEFSPIKPYYFTYKNYHNIEVLSLISYPLIGLFSFMIFLKFLKKEVDLVNATLFITLLVPFLYKSGYSQYYTVHFATLFYWLSKCSEKNIDDFFEKKFIYFLPLIFVTYFSFIYGYANHIFQNEISDPIWMSGDYGTLKIEEWAGFIGLFFFLPPLFMYNNNNFRK